MTFEMITKEYEKVSSRFIETIKEMTSEDFLVPNEELRIVLQEGKEKLETLMQMTAFLNPQETKEELIRAIQYKIMNGILCFRDLLVFEADGLKERFLLRFENYIQRERVNGLFHS